MKVFVIRDDSPAFRALKRNFPVKDGQFIPMSNKEFDAYKEDVILVEVGETKKYQAHIRALACHCECMGMYGENLWTSAEDHPPKFVTDDFKEVMRKWRLINDKGEPII